MTLSITQRAEVLSDYASMAYSRKHISKPVFEDNNPDTEFYAVAYRDSQTGKIIVSFAGTNELQDALGADVALVRNMWHPQFDDAIDFLSKLTDQEYGQGNYSALQSNVLVTGHSLGGALAQLTAQLYGLDGATFDPAAAKSQTMLQEYQDAANRVRVNPNTYQISKKRGRIYF